MEFCSPRFLEFSGYFIADLYNTTNIQLMVSQVINVVLAYDPRDNWFESQSTLVQIIKQGSEHYLLLFMYLQPAILRHWGPIPLHFALGTIQSHLPRHWKAQLLGHSHRALINLLLQYPKEFPAAQGLWAWSPGLITSFDKTDCKRSRVLHMNVEISILRCDVHSVDQWMDTF